MRLTHLALAAALALGVSAVPAPQLQKKDAALKDTLTRYYKLESDSSFVRGCFDPCDCPLQLVPDFRGTFELQPVPSADLLTRTFEVRGVNWLVGSGDAEIRIVGSGTYRIQSHTGLQAMRLSIRLDDGPPTTFDSGWVPGAGSGRLPKIRISLDTANQVCFDTVLNIAATPQRRSALRPYSIDSGSFQEGCLPPCLCPIAQAQPVSGTFLLLPLGMGPAGNVEFAVLDVDWAIHPAPPSPLPAFTPVSGRGIYQVNVLSLGPIGIHRMLLDLDVGGAEDRWDSGPAPDTGPFPKIDIALGINGFQCFERVFAFVASPD